MKNSRGFFYKLSLKYSTPNRVQKFLRDFEYNREVDGESLKSALSSVKHKNVHCLEAALLAAAILEQKGFAPRVAILASADGLDHVIYVYQVNQLWGSIARSRDRGLHGRKPVFTSLRELVESYYEPFVDNTGKLVGYQIANLNDVSCDWRCSTRNVWMVEKHLIGLPCVRINRPHKIYQKLLSRFLKIGPISSGKSWL